MCSVTLLDVIPVTPTVCITDEDSHVIGDGNFVELTKTDEEFLNKQFSGGAGDGVNSGYLFHKETDGLRRRWCVLEEKVLKCYKRNNQNFLFEVNFRDGEFSAIQGCVGKMFAIRLSSAKAPRSYLFASPKAEVCASWMMRFSAAGVQLQDDILREVSMNQQNNNKVTWALADDTVFSDKDVFRSNLLEALEYIERRKSSHILPKRSSYSFKELDVLKKLKASLVSKKAESKLNRRKTWSAGSFPNHIAMVERFRTKPISLSDDLGLENGKAQEEETKPSENEKSLPEILTSSGITKVDKQDPCHLETSVESVDHLSTSEDNLSFAVSMPEGLNQKHVVDTECSSYPQESTNTQSVPDLLILPGQESPNQSSAKQEKHLKPSSSLTRVMTVKASLVKNAIMTGLRRKGRRSGGRAFLDREQAPIHGCLFRKKGIHWKQRWCLVTKGTLYGFRDTSYEHEDFRCKLGKYFVMRSEEEPGRAYSFKLVRRKGDQIVLAAEDSNDLERWMDVLMKATSKRFSEDYAGGSRSSSLTASSLCSVDTIGDSSATEDAATDGDVRGSYNGETTDKDSSDENSTTNSVSLKLKTRGINEKGYVYYLVGRDTWEHCWMEVIFGVVSIYSSSERKSTVLQRDHISLCDIQENSTDGQRPHSFVFKKAGREPMCLEVDSEADYMKWLKCFESWKSKDIDMSRGSNVDTVDNSVTERIAGDDVETSDDNVLTAPAPSPIGGTPAPSPIGGSPAPSPIGGTPAPSPIGGTPAPSPIGGTPATSDSDCYVDHESNENVASRLRSRLSMSTVLTPTTPKLNRQNKSSTTMPHTSELQKNASKASFLYHKANSGLWVKYWCVLHASIISSFNSTAEVNAAFTVDVQGCEVSVTSHKSKKCTFDIFNRELDIHFEFAGESTYVMYAWMRVIKIAAGLVTKKATKSNEEDAIGQSKSSAESPDVQPEPNVKRAVMKPIMTEATIDGVTAGGNKRGRQTSEGSKYEAPQPTSTSAPTSPRRKAKITSLDEVLKLLQEKQLEQQLQNKNETASNRAKMKWKHSMLVVLRKGRSLSPESSKSSGVVVKESENVVAELDQKTARLKYREISEKYDHMLESEKLQMLRRGTLLKKRRNSLILRKEILEKKLSKYRDSSKAPLKKRQVKDAKEMAHLKGDSEEVAKQLTEIKKELDGVEQHIETNSTEQKKVHNELNEQRQKELREVRITADASLLTSKSNLHDGKKLRRRQVSDSSLSAVAHSPEENRKPKLSQSLSSPSGDLRAKASSLSSPRLPKAPSSPLLRTKTYDASSGLGRPSMKSRASQEALSAALSQIEDFEAFAQGSFRGADIGC